MRLWRAPPRLISEACEASNRQVRVPGGSTTNQGANARRAPPTGRRRRGRRLGWYPIGL